MMEAGVRVVSDDEATNRSLHQLTAPPLAPLADSTERLATTLDHCVARFNNAAKLCNGTAKSHDALRSGQLVNNTTHDIDNIIREADETIKKILREADIALRGKLSELESRVDHFVNDVASTAGPYWYREVGDLMGLLRFKP